MKRVSAKHKQAIYRTLFYYIYDSKNAPTIPANTVSKIGFTLNRMLATAAIKKIALPTMEIEPSGFVNIVDQLAPGKSNTPDAMVIAAAAIRPTAAGFTPDRKLFITLFSR